MATIEENAQLANHVYFRTDENRTPVPDDWTELEWHRDGAVTGFSAGVYQKGDEIVIAFTGTNERMVGDFAVANVPTAMGYPSPQVVQAMSIVMGSQLSLGSR